MNKGKASSRRSAVNKTRIADAEVRQRAVHENHSFIIQAPAGSGKTELLTQRYLRLLATVQEPEEIIAITFTRKAASEMQQRILQSLAAAEGEPPTEIHKKRTYELAQAASAHDRERSWKLDKHPARLRIQTIDSFNAMLTRQMPVLAQFGSQPAISELPENLYQEAAERCLQADSGDATHHAAIRQLLLHLDNDFLRARTLLVRMLEKRDQWLPHLVRDRTNREALQEALAREVESQLRLLRMSIPENQRDELVSLSAYAADQVGMKDENSPIAACKDCTKLPGDGVENLAVWKGVTHWLLTKGKKASWRKTVNVQVGFPPHDNGEKQRALELLRNLNTNDGLLSRLITVRALPQPVYTEAQWVILDALLVLLPLAVAELLVVFGERAEVDYAELSLRALATLGSEDNPSDFALSLDYRISHLLVDEFQDTSSNQLKLLERLTAGWQSGDGRTMFVVGDPMQSIYRFREAEVGLFLRACSEGIGCVELEPLVLNVNFRSQAGIVDWVNEVFKDVLPADEDIASGAVPYSACVAQHAALEQPAVCIHPNYTGDVELEADRVLELLQEAEANPDNASTAILVSSRTHLAEIVPRMRQAGLRFRAVEIEHLGNRPVVQDLLALTRALFYETDRTAWLAILRAPWCGLTLSELHALLADDAKTPVSDVLQQVNRLARISDTSRQRVDALVSIVTSAQRNRCRQTVRDLVESTWIRLGGPACLENQEDLEDAEAYLSLVDAFEDEGDLPDIVELQSELKKLYAHPDAAAPESLQVMTMHKAKGLEFDTVILPGLGRSPRSDDPQLLQWLERPREHDIDLLLATIGETGAERDSVYDFLASLNREKNRYEQGRLLYVATTRAKRQLHLLGHVSVRETRDGTEIRQPPDNTLLAQLWPKVENIFRERFNADTESGSRGKQAGEHLLRRLPTGYSLPECGEDIRGDMRKYDVASSINEVDYFWAGETARHVGTVVHAALERIANEGEACWDDNRVIDLRPSMQRKLAELGVTDSDLEAATDRTMTAIQNMLSHEQGRWLLSADHDQTAAEFPLSGIIDDVLYNVTLDRTFIDESGTRWIIDYKTSQHEGGNKEAFIANERNRYRQQLDRYATLMRHYSDHPVRVGLYFPLLGQFEHWDPFEESSDDRSTN